jgi:Ala-tRNA(Pro) deacylase
VGGDSDEGRATAAGALGFGRRAKVFALFDELGIGYEVVEHPAIFSQADSEAKRVDVGAVIFKNLFLRNKDRSRYYLLSLPLEKRANLSALQRELGEKHLTFGDEAALAEKLNITPGSVSILNIIDTDVKQSAVTLIIDKVIFTYGKFGVHPNDNTATLVFSPRDLPKLLDSIGAEYRFIDMDEK